MIQFKELLVNYEEFEEPQMVILEDGCSVKVLGKCNIQLTMLFKVSSLKRVTMFHVLYVPKLTCNLFLVRTAVSKGNYVKYENDRFYICNCDGKLLDIAILINKLYYLNCKTVRIQEWATVASVSFCEECVEEKMFKKPYKSLGEIRSTRKLQCMHSDSMWSYIYRIHRWEEIFGYFY